MQVNNINQHFVTAFMGRHLHSDMAMTPFLDLKQEVGYKLKHNAKTGPKLDDSGRPILAYVHGAHDWKGFSQYASAGIIVEQAPAGKAPRRRNSAKQKDEHLEPSCLPPRL